jgi:hypothetical protein
MFGCLPVGSFVLLFKEARGLFEIYLTYLYLDRTTSEVPCGGREDVPCVDKS